jgi:3-phenylpropionate/trans-cinnamate dioxygenase ferredoxin subunit
MGFVKVASVDDVPPGNMKGVEAGGKEIMIANVEGTFYAIGDPCTHMGCKLSDGRIYEKVVQCICHGSRFNVETGGVVDSPAVEAEPVYKVKVEGGDVYVEI